MTINWVQTIAVIVITEFDYTFTPQQVIRGLGICSFDYWRPRKQEKTANN